MNPDIRAAGFWAGVWYFCLFVFKEKHGQDKSLASITGKQKLPCNECWSAFGTRADSSVVRRETFP